MNQLSQPELWGNIQKFNPDDPHSSLPFSKKLAKENNWSASFTSKAIEEYKKFMYLCCVSPTGASPSDVVDQVWHMHLTYTSSYWIDFCKNTLHKDIHHYPSKGGAIENEKHKNWYNSTLLLYEQTFGTKPPASVWPQGNDPDIDEPVYDKKLFTRTSIIFFIIAAVLIVSTDMYHLRGKDFLHYFPVLAAIGLIIMLIQLRDKSKRLEQVISDHLPRQFSKWQMLKFLNGPHRCYQSALIELVRDGKLEVQRNSFKLLTQSGSMANHENPLWENLVRDYQAGETFTYENGFSLFDQERIKHPGFEKLFRLSKKTDFLKLIIPGFVLAAGIARVMQGLANNKPVDYLVLELMLTGFIFIGVLGMYSYTTRVFKIVREIWSADNAYGYSNDLSVNYGILGIMAVSGFAEYTILNSLFEKKTPQSGSSFSSGCSSCSGGSSCGGGGCGGGCGGCGGGD